MPASLIPARLKRPVLLALLAAACGTAAGCHNLQEHRRARWNYGDGMNHGGDPYAAVVTGGGTVG